MQAGGRKATARRGEAALTSTIESASSMVALDNLPVMSAMKPTPQASHSDSGCCKKKVKGRQRHGDKMYYEWPAGGEGGGGGGES